MSAAKQAKEIYQATERLRAFVLNDDTHVKRLVDYESELFGPLVDKLGLDFDEFLALFEEYELENMILNFVMEESSTLVWHPETESVLQKYLKQKGWREGPAGRMYLLAMQESTFDAWEVVDVNPGSWVVIRPAGTEGRKIKVFETLASEQLQRWDLILAKPVRVGTRTIFTQSILPLPRDAVARIQKQRDEFVTDITNMVKEDIEQGKLDDMPDDFETGAIEEFNHQLSDYYFQLWALYTYDQIVSEPPSLVNFDGDQLNQHNLVRPLKVPAGEIVEALSELPHFLSSNDRHFDWIETRGDDQIVMGTVNVGEKSISLHANSTARIEALNDMFTAQFGDQLGKSMEVFSNAQGSSFGDVPELTPEMQDHLNRRLKEHYLKTLDEPVPMLGNKTPRECSQSEADRPQVIDWVKELENSQKNNPSFDFDVSFLRAELGLEDHEF